MDRVERQAMQQVIHKSLLSLTLLLLTAPVISAGLPAGTSIQILADASFSDLTGTYNAAPASQTLTVMQSAAIAIEAGQAPQSTSPGMTYYIPMRVINNGNGTDLINLSTSSSAGWSRSLIRDDNSDGIRQASEVTLVTSTGPLAADASFRCFASITVPSGTTAGSTMAVTAASAFDQASVTSVAFVMSAPSAHTISFTQLPTVSPSTVDPAGTTQCSAAASDSLGHVVTYTWSDGGAGGTFGPSVTTQNPTYKAPASTSAAITLTCNAACSQDAQTSKTTQTTLAVRSATAPKVVGIIPVNGETTVGLKCEIVVTFDQAMDRQAVESAISVTPALNQPVFNWLPDSTRVWITHTGYNPGATYDVTVSTGAKSASGASLASAYSWSFKAVSTAQFEPNTAITNVGARFLTPAIKLNDPSCPSSVSLTVGIPATFAIDTTSVNGSLACVQKGADTSTIRSTWNAQTREIAVSADMATPGSNVEIVKAITLTAPSTQGTQQLTINGSPALTVSVSGSVPGDFNGNGLVDSSDLSLFSSEWARWHKSTARTFDPTADRMYDLAPRNNGPWPAWTPIGDKKINISDAAAFIEGWVRSQNTTMAYSQYVSTSVSRSRITVTASSAPYGMFQADISLPSTAKFHTNVSTSGNLLYVVPQRGAGSIFYSEYDAVSRTVRITGIVNGAAPYYVAQIYIY